MGKIIAAFATSHIVMDSKGVEEQANRVLAGFREIRRRVEATAPDALVVIADDHLTNFFFDNMPTFCLSISEELEGFGDVGIPKYKMKVHQALAKAFLTYAIESGFDLAHSEEIRPDHGTMFPLHFITPRMDIPIVLLIQNCFSPPLPTPRRCYQLGRLLRQFIEEMRPESERVAVLATGGLSHWLMTPEMGKVSEDFDRHVLDLVAQGRGEELANLTYEEIMREAGNGGQEIRNWITMLGAMEGYNGEVLYYEPMPAWFTGMAAVAMKIPASV